LTWFHKIRFFGGDDSLCLCLSYQKQYTTVQYTYLLFKHLTGACYIFFADIEYLFSMDVSDIVNFYADVKPKLSIFQAVVRYLTGW